MYNLFAGYDQTLKPDSVIQQTELIQQITTPVLEDGKHTFSVRAIDYDGNLSRIATFDFTVDTVRPSVLITKPAPNQSAVDRPPVFLMVGEYSYDDSPTPSRQPKGEVS